MPSENMDSSGRVAAGPPDLQHCHQTSGPLDDGVSSSSTSRSSYSRDFSKHPLPPTTRTSFFSRLNPRNWTRKMRIFVIISFVLTVVALIPAIAVPLTLQAEHRHGHRPTLVNPPATQPIAGGKPLRIMPLGASITYGFRSSDRNGYREKLLFLLEQGGNKDVTYVGSRKQGDMTKNAVEGWPGLRIDQVLPKARASVPKDLPNVILLNVGTNDCVQDFNINLTNRASATAPELTANATFTVGTRMRMMVDDLLEWSPNATVVMSTLINNKNQKTQARVLNANEQFRAVAAQLQAQGSKVVLADMSAAAGGPNMTTMADVTHPDDAGYAMMANRWYLALVEASQKGLITAPRSL